VAIVASFPLLPEARVEAVKSGRPALLAAIRLATEVMRVG